MSINVFTHSHIFRWAFLRPEECDLFSAICHCPSGLFLEHQIKTPLKLKLLNLALGMRPDERKDGQTDSKINRQTDRPQRQI